MRPEINLKWLVDWDAASRHPRRVQFLLFIGGFFAGWLIAYFRFADHDALRALVAGLAAGLVLVFVGRRYQRNPAVAYDRAVGRHVFEIVMAVSGIGLLTVGALTASSAVMLSAIPFLAIALIMFVAKRSLSRTSS